MFDTLMIQNASTALSIEEVQGEAQELLVAGSDTTATTLLYACVHLARQPELWERLYQEVKPVFEDPYNPPPVNVLEQLPFLTACLKESTSGIVDILAGVSITNPGFRSPACSTRSVLSVADCSRRRIYPERERRTS